MAYYRPSSHRLSLLVDLGVCHNYTGNLAAIDNRLTAYAPRRVLAAVRAAVDFGPTPINDSCLEAFELDFFPTVQGMTYELQ